MRTERSVLISQYDEGYRELIKQVLTKGDDPLFEEGAVTVTGIINVEMLDPENPPGVIFTGLRDPYGDMATIAEIKERFPNVPVVVVTAHGPEYEMECRAAGASLYVQKAEAGAIAQLKEEVARLIKEDGG